MSFGSWLKRSWGRTREGTKAHLVDTARLLDLGPTVIEKMKLASDEECESLLIEHIEGRHGAVVDWKASLEDLREALSDSLTNEERSSLGRAAEIGTQRIYKTSPQIRALLRPPMRALRILESFGDAYIVVLVPMNVIEQFDQANQHWTI